MNKHEQKILSFLEDRLLTETETSSLSVLRNNTGKYLLYGKYNISTSADLTFQVVIKNTSKVRIFSNLKTAFTWCFFHYKHKLFEAQDIETTDNRLTSISSQIVVQDSIMRNTKNQDVHAIALAKMSDLIFNRTRLNKKLTKYINISKSWQESAFDKGKYSRTRK